MREGDSVNRPLRSTKDGAGRKGESGLLFLHEQQRA